MGVLPQSIDLIYSFGYNCNFIPEAGSLCLVIIAILYRKQAVFGYNCNFIPVADSLYSQLSRSMEGYRNVIRVYDLLIEQNLIEIFKTLLSHKS